MDEDTRREFDEFDAALRQASGPGTIRVFRLPLGEDGRPQHNSSQVVLFAVPLGSATLEDIIARCKKSYMLPTENFLSIRLIGTMQGKKGTLFSKVVTIQRSREENANLQAGGNESIAAILRAVQESTDKNMEMMRQIFSEQMQSRLQTPQRDPLELITTLIGALTPIVGALSARPAPAGASIVEQITALKALKDLSSDFLGETSSGEDGDSIGAILKGAAPLLQSFAEVAKSMPRPAAPMVRANLQRRLVAGPAAQAAPVAPTAAPAAAKPAPVVSPAPVASTSPDASATAVSPVQVSPGDNQAMLMQLRPQLLALAEMAAEGADPVTAAEIALQSLPNDEQVDEALYGLLSDEKCIEKLCTIQPAVKGQIEWFQKFRAAMLAQFVSEDEPESVTTKQ